MHPPRIDERAIDRRAVRRELPFRFRRQTSAGPTRERIRLEIAHVTDWIVRSERLIAGQRELDPFAPVTLPVQRRGPASLADRRPTVREPKLRPSVAAI